MLMGDEVPPRKVCAELLKSEYWCLIIKNKLKIKMKVTVVGAGSESG